uniref:Peptidase M14 carboxypeptidase A domain-containing protein n=1 Tax=Globodera rostochiensis TaxID=31243 RepID=A0A914I3M1_GLORO
MFRALIIFIFALCSSAANGFYNNYDGYKVIRAIPKNESQLLALQHLTNLVESKRRNVQFWQYSYTTYAHADIFASPDEAQQVLDFLDNNWIWHDTIVANYGDQLESAANERRASPGKLENPAEFDLGKYHQFDAIVAYLQLLADQNSKFISFHSLGKTFEGRQIPYLKFGFPAKNGKKKPILVVDAGIHAREWIAPATALHFIDAMRDPGAGTVRS